MSSRERVVVIFAYHFPPENAVGARRPFRFAKYLAKLGYNCRVFTAAEQSGDTKNGVEYVPDPFLICDRRSFHWQVERGIRKLFVPGHVGTQWSYHAARAARSHIRAHPDASITIFSTYPPLGSHLAAWQLAREGRCRWIADFRDPLGDERMQQGMNIVHRTVSRRLEKMFVHTADAVIANTEAARQRLQKKFPDISEKIELIWNGFDPENRIVPLPIPRRDHRVLSHVGEIYAGRNVTPILESIGRLIASQRIAIGAVRVRLIGPAESHCLPSPEFIARAKGQGWLDLNPRQIPQCEATLISQTSDSLLLLEPQTSLRAPAKLYDYLQIGRPILAFIEPNSPSELLLKGGGIPYRCVYPSSSSEMIDDAILGFLDLHSTAVAPSRWFEQEFNAETQTGKLAALICSLQDSYAR